MPPTFAAVYAVRHGIEQMLADPELGIDVGKMRHGEQDIVWDRPPRAGETITAHSRLVADVVKGRLRLLTVETEAGSSRSRSHGESAGAGPFR